MRTDWRGLQDLQRMVRQGERVVERTVAVGALDTWGTIRKEAPVDHGRLSGSFMIEKRSRFVHRVWTDVEYAEAVRTGTKPHVIRPVHAKALRFKVGGEVVFATKVNHPGTKGNDYVKRTVDKVQGRIPDYVAQAMRDVGL